MGLEISKNNKTALIFGASGMVGRHCLDYLLLSPAYDKVVAFGRGDLGVKNQKLVYHRIDFDRLEDYNHLIKGDDLYCCLGTTMRKAGSKLAFQKVDYHYVYEIAKIAAHNTVNQYLLVSAVGADKDSLFFYNQVKGKAEEAVKQLPFWSVHIFRPSVLLGERNENRWGEEVAGKLGRLIDSVTGGLLKKYKPVEGDVVAKAMVAAAQKLKGGVNYYSSEMLQDLATAVDKLRRLN